MNNSPSDNYDLIIHEKDVICGWPRKLDNLTWCKIPVN